MTHTHEQQIIQTGRYKVIRSELRASKERCEEGGKRRQQPMFYLSAMYGEACPVLGDLI